MVAKPEVGLHLATDSGTLCTLESASFPGALIAFSRSCDILRRTRNSISRKKKQSERLGRLPLNELSVYISGPDKSQDKHVKENVSTTTRSKRLLVKPGTPEQHQSGTPEH